MKNNQIKPEMNKVIAILPMRAGSVRINDKNIRIVGYYPLFYHIIQTCLSLSEIDKIVVSTDSKKYKEIVEHFFGNDSGVEVILRPHEISGGDIKSEEVINQILIDKKYSNYYKYILLVQATTPLTSAEDIKKGINKIIENDYKSVFAVSKSHRFYLDDFNQLLNRPMTQEKTPTFFETGCFWLIDINEFKNANNRIVEPYSWIEVDDHCTLDIDDEKDMILADMLLSKKIRSTEKRYFKSRKINQSNIDKYYGENKDPDGVIRNILFEKKSRIDFAKDEINFINNLVNEKLFDENPKLLSVGLGGGYAEEVISSKYIKYAIEPDKEAALVASNKVDYLFNDSFENVDFKNDYFNVVFAHHVIEHLEDPIMFIKKINRVLKVGGKLVLGTPNFDSAAARRYGDKFRLLSDPTHISLFSEIGLRHLLEDYGFLINKIDFPYFETKFFNKENLNKILSKDGVSPPFYGSIMTFYATKK